MTREVRIYAEGGGKGAGTRELIRLGFRKFLQGFVAMARVRGIKFEIIACGSRNDAFGRFSKALNEHPHAFNVLLVDSEGPVHTGRRDHLKARDRWDLEGVAEDQCHLMVQAMEAWLVADPEIVRTFYGQGFNSNPLPNPGNIETAEVSRLLSALKEASRHTQKGEYGKIKHGSELLKKASPAAVRCLKHGKSFFEAIESVISRP